MVAGRVPSPWLSIARRKLSKRRERFSIAAALAERRGDGGVRATVRTDLEELAVLERRDGRITVVRSHPDYGNSAREWAAYGLVEWIEESNGSLNYFCTPPSDPAFFERLKAHLERRHPGHRVEIASSNGETA